MSITRVRGFVPVALSNASIRAISLGDQAMMERIAELEAALDEIGMSSYPLLSSRTTGSDPTAMCVPIGAWENAMRMAKQKS